MKPVKIIMLPLSYGLSLVLLCSASPALGQRVPSQALSAGGGTTQADGVRIVSTLGQPAIGATGTRYRAVGGGFWYHIRTGGLEATDIEAFTPNDGELPHVYRLNQNYPNPFNPRTTIRFELPESAHVRLVIHNALGQEVRRLVEADLSPGVYRVTWDATDDPGIPVSSGIYLYRIETGEFSATRTLVLVK